METTYTIGSLVECAHDVAWQNAHRDADAEKARKLGKRNSQFIGNAAAYMHTDEAYVVEGITQTGGLRIRGFMPTVSVTDVRPSTKPVCR